MEKAESGAYGVVFTIPIVLTRQPKILKAAHGDEVEIQFHRPFGSIMEGVEGAWASFTISFSLVNPALIINLISHGQPKGSLAIISVSMSWKFFHLYSIFTFFVFMLNY
jgi:hypothetical protein